MKLSAFVAIAAVIGTSLAITAKPVKAGCYPSLAASKMETMLYLGMSHKDAYYYVQHINLHDGTKGCDMELRGYIIQYKSLFPQSASIFNR